MRVQGGQVKYLLGSTVHENRICKGKSHSTGGGFSVAEHRLAGCQLQQLAGVDSDGGGAVGPQHSRGCTDLDGITQRRAGAVHAQACMAPQRGAIDGHLVCRNGEVGRQGRQKLMQVGLIYVETGHHGHPQAAKSRWTKQLE